MRQDAIKQAERERRDKYKKQEDEREGIRAGIREKVGGGSIYYRVTSQNGEKLP